MVSNAPMHRGDLLYRIQQLERLVRDRTGGRSLENSSIGAGGLKLKDGGSLTVDGGELVLKSEEGVVVARFGQVWFGESARGYEFNYPSGKRAFALGGSTNNPVVITYDASGNYVFTTDGTSGTGIGRPYLNYHLVPSFDGEVSTSGPMWPSTTSSAYTKLWEGTNSVWHPRIRLRIATTASAGTTQWRFLIDDTTITSGSGGVWDTYKIPGWGERIKPGESHDLKLEVRQSGGGRGWAVVQGCYGMQS